MSVLTDWFERFRASGTATLSRDADKARPEAILTKHAGRLMRLKGVLSVGIGRTEDGRPAIVVGMDTNEPEILEAIPKTLDGIPVIYDRAGRGSSA